MALMQNYKMANAISSAVALAENDIPGADLKKT